MWIEAIICRNTIVSFCELKELSTISVKPNNMEIQFTERRDTPFHFMNANIKRLRVSLLSKCAGLAEDDASVVHTKKTSC